MRGEVLQRSTAGLLGLLSLARLKQIQVTLQSLGVEQQACSVGLRILHHREVKVTLDEKEGRSSSAHGHAALELCVSLPLFCISLYVL